MKQTLDIKRIDMPIETKTTALNAIEDNLRKHGRTLNARAGTDMFKICAAGEPDKFFWLDGDCNVRCAPEYVRTLQFLGLNPIVSSTPSEKTSALDIQVAGSHYKDMKIQPWELMRAVMTREEYTAYHTGTVIAYLMRHKAKGGEQDIKKAQHHLTELVEYLDAA